MLAERLPPRVVLIADEEPLQRHVTAVLSRSFSELDVRGARDADEAMDLLEDEQSRLLITDAQARRIDGLALAARAHSRRPELPVIVMSSPSRDRASASDLPPTAAWLDKPPHIERLIGLVRRCLVKPAGFSGKLDLDNLPELVQFLCMSNASGALDVEALGQHGSVFFERGAIVDAISDSARGVPAFHELLRWRAGVFVLDRKRLAEERTIELTSMQLLLDGMRLLDQEQAARGPNEARRESDSARARPRVTSQTRLRSQAPSASVSKPAPRNCAKPSPREGRSDPVTLRMSNPLAAMQASTSQAATPAAAAHTPISPTTPQAAAPHTPISPTTPQAATPAAAPHPPISPPAPQAATPAAAPHTPISPPARTASPTLPPVPSPLGTRATTPPATPRTTPPPAASQVEARATEPAGDAHTVARSTGAPTPTAAGAGNHEQTQSERRRPPPPTAANDNQPEPSAHANSALPLLQRLQLMAAEAPQPSPGPDLFTSPTSSPPARPQAPSPLADPFTSPPPSDSALRDLAARSFQRGMEFAMRKQYAEAVQEWQQASQLDPDNRTYTTNLRRLHEVMRRTSQGDTRADEE
jgi:CheY-like chemotaxis protein